MELYPSKELYPYTVSLLLFESVFDRVPSASTWPKRLQSNKVAGGITVGTNWVVVVVFVN